MKRICLLWLLLFSISSFGQRPDTLLKKLDSLGRQPDSTGAQVNNTAPGAYNEATGINAKTFFVLEASNLKQAFSKPFRMTRQNWKDVGKFALVVGALSLTDEAVQQFTLNLRDHNKGLRNVSHYVTEFGGTYEGYTLGALGAYGFLSGNKKLQTTTLLAAQSYMTGAAVSAVVKFLTGRQRPFYTDPKTLEAEPTFRGPFTIVRDANGKKINNSFPSGHTTVAFAAATVYALEYRNHPWVPVLAYTAASLVGLSRITENKHWVTDVVSGAALGYLSGKLVVNNYHRYARLRSPKQAGNSLSFSMAYDNGVLTPGLVYRF